MVRMFKWLAPAVAVLGLVFSVSTLQAADAPVAAGAGTVSGTVVDATGKAAGSLAVRILKAPEKAPRAPKDAAPKAEKPAGAGDRKGGGTPVAEGTTDAEGKFSITGVPAGDYMVMAGAKGVGMARGKVSVKAGETTTVTLTLQDRKAGGEKPKAPKAPK